ncbi:MAG: ATP-binding protein [Brevinematia bacterium]
MANENGGNSKVGIVIGTKESTPCEFWFEVFGDNPVCVDDIVKVENYVERIGKVSFFGVVVNILKGFEGVDFHSWNKETLRGIIPYQVYHIAHVRITRIEPESKLIPPDPGSEVFRVVSTEETRKAMNMDDKKNLLPAGILNNGEVAYINWEFINGQKGAHISISGISGIATKTSYSLFLIHSMMYCRTIDEREKRNLRALVFSVKGEDLLHIDKESREFDNNAKLQFEKMGLETTPFRTKDINFYLPPDPEDPSRPLTSERQDEKTCIYGWSLKDFFKERLVEYMFDQEERENDNFTYVLNHFSDVMKREAEESPECRVEVKVGNKVFNLVSLYDDAETRKVVDKIKNSERIDISLSQLLELTGQEDENLGVDTEELRRFFFPSKAQHQTISKFIRKFAVCAKDISFLVRMKESKKVDWESKKVTVISISDKFLSFRAQRFVVGSILSELYFGEKTPKSKGLTVFVMLDELNKYAPAVGFSPIKNILLDIAERGRSLGIILIGAQQMASEVDPRIISNSSVKVNGRLDSAEVENRVYRHLSSEFREKAKKIRSGTMILFQPDIEVPLVINFPKPPYATRKEEIKPSETELKEIESSFA